MRKPVFGVSDQVLHKSGCTARGSKFRIKEVEGLYYLSRNESADQLCGYRAADLRLSIHICKKGFIMTRPILIASTIL